MNSVRRVERGVDAVDGRRVAAPREAAASRDQRLHPALLLGSTQFQMGLNSGCKRQPRRRPRAGPRAWPGPLPHPPACGPGWWGRAAAGHGILWSRPPPPLSSAWRSTGHMGVCVLGQLRRAQERHIGALAPRDARNLFRVGGDDGARDGGTQSRHAMECPIRGTPASGRIFLPGNPFDPPRAGITARHFHDAVLTSARPPLRDDSRTNGARHRTPPAPPPRRPPWPARRPARRCRPARRRGPDGSTFVALLRPRTDLVRLARPLETRLLQDPIPFQRAGGPAGDDAAPGGPAGSSQRHAHGRPAVNGPLQVGLLLRRNAEAAQVAQAARDAPGPAEQPAPA